MRIAFTTVAKLSAERLAANEAHNNGLGLPRIGRAKAPALAIVGGGPSINEQVEAIRSFDGEVWAINGAHQWCLERRIDATLFSLDPLVLADVPHPSLVKRAVLSVSTEPFDVLRHADIELVKIGDGGLPSGPTSATGIPAIAAERGNTSVTFFGCESSYTQLQHAYPGGIAHGELLLVECDGEQFLTSGAMLMQAQILSAVIRAAPMFREESGGLLRAMVNDQEWDIVAATRAVHDSITWEAA